MTAAAFLWHHFKSERDHQKIVSINESEGRGKKNFHAKSDF
jgi:hypothetical protein